MYAKDKIEIKNGELNVSLNISYKRDLHCLSSDGEFIMSGGTLNALSTGQKSACINITDKTASMK